MIWRRKLLGLCSVAAVLAAAFGFGMLGVEELML
jgi:hypothetical protein